ncbi:hypothetical protein CORC01_13751 [Colletotrichum orchidophilum]|uniref:Protein kinase domain-containing protein n=1 Tax=Colletotrichum orchidophilum TaxID=1209926 RepID=A0A1G4APH5_9PEZI|nr:uncharacterized protein CORC01_13751 [Colletotrichum orchidophilum]OHE90942.1 hypothetical protein CORC01_13751 [Colletotrichum orchidophilum]
MSVNVQFDYSAEFDTAVNEFKTIRAEETRISKCGGEFVIVGNVTRRLKTRSPSCHNRFQDDLDRLCQTHWLRQNFMQPPTMQLEALEGYLCVFYILLDIGAPSQIDVFRENGLSDNKLPFDKTILNSDRIRVWSFEKFSDAFFEVQLAWCPVQFELGMRENYFNRIIPVLEKTEIKPHRDGGGPRKNNASLYSIEVPEEMVGLELQRKMASARFKRQGDPSQGFRYRFALKQFEFERPRNFRNEANMSEYLRDKDGMVQYIGWYQGLETDGEGTQHEYYNLVLELGDSDLYTVFRTSEPPVSPKEISSFWHAMFGVSETLASIYKLRLGGVDYDTWHADIKPENILRVGNRFKLADLGEAYIKLSNADNRRQGARVTGGTRTYGAPEKAAYLDSRSMQEPSITQASDIWSLGCVFLVAAIYVALGPQAVLQYARIRRAGLFARTGEISDTFHYNDAVLPEAIKVPKYIRVVLRKTDMYTAAVLDMVDQHMLVADPEGRFTADQVRDWFKARFGTISDCN